MGSVGRRSHRDCDRDLVSRLDRQVPGQQSRQSVLFVLHQPAGTVFSFEAHRQRLDPRFEGRHPLTRGPFLGLQFRDTRIGMT